MTNRLKKIIIIVVVVLFSVLLFLSLSRYIDLEVTYKYEIEGVNKPTIVLDYVSFRSIVLSSIFWLKVVIGLLIFNLIFLIKMIFKIFRNTLES